ncbi:hypothetical protein TNCV_4790521 [Trichonephila clavipes]|nr:hypothetical protein TNCV_4790521 [Trichonephila clavipes]
MGYVMDFAYGPSLPQSSVGLKESISVAVHTIDRMQCMQCARLSFGRASTHQMIVEFLNVCSRCISWDRVVVYSASTPQIWGSINGLRKVDSAFLPRYIGSINEYQACFGS